MKPHIDPVQREEWIAAGLVQSPLPEESWFDRITAERPSQIETNNFGQYIGVCELHDRRALSISRMEKVGHQWIFSVYYQQPEQTNLL